MAKLSTKSSDGTSYHSVDIKTSVKRLTEVLGEAQCIENTGNDKTNYDWTCETETGSVFTIYDWKEYRAIEEDEEIEFHIGSFNQAISIQAKAELEEMLK